MAAPTLVAEVVGDKNVISVERLVTSHATAPKAEAIAEATETKAGTEVDTEAVEEDRLATPAEVCCSG